MKKLKITGYTSYEKMNMLKTKAGFYKHGFLLEALEKGYTHVKVCSQKTKTISAMLKSCDRWKCLAWHDEKLGSFPFARLFNQKLKLAKQKNIEYLPI